MKTLACELNSKTSSNEAAIRILLIGSLHKQELWQIIESTREFHIIGEVSHRDVMTTKINLESPDIIVVFTDNGIPIEILNDTLETLRKIQMNKKTMILSDNPVMYLELAIKTGIAALLYRKIGIDELVLLIHEIYKWSHDPSILYDYSARANLVLRLNQEVNEM